MHTGTRVRASAVVAALVACLADSAPALIPAAASRQGQGQATTAADKPQMVLFMCPHGAAKSVLASAYFQRRAKERGLNVRVESAGTEPDATVAPAVAAHLTRNQYAIPVAAPRQVTAQDLATADVVVSLGCDLKGLPEPRGTLLKWDEVPSPGDDFNAADKAIRTRVNELVEALIRQRGKR
jgi:arsenate reductase (thioredoxin)